MPKRAQATQPELLCGVLSPSETLDSRVLHTPHSKILNAGFSSQIPDTEEVSAFPPSSHTTNICLNGPTLLLSSFQTCLS